jgi:UrcA family protein
MSRISPISPRRVALFAVAAAGLALSAPLAPAQAQPYDGYGGGGEVTITAPSPTGERAPDTGAPIEWVATSRVVHYDDLDLNTRWGDHELRARLWQAATAACDDLDVMYPVSAPDNPPCVRAAYRHALYQTPLGY